MPNYLMQPASMVPEDWPCKCESVCACPPHVSGVGFFVETADSFLSYSSFLTYVPPDPPTEEDPGECNAGTGRYHDHVANFDTGDEQFAIQLRCCNGSAILRVSYFYLGDHIVDFESHGHISEITTACTSESLEFGVLGSSLYVHIYW